MRTSKVRTYTLVDKRTGVRIVLPEMNNAVDMLTVIGWNGSRFSRSKEGLLYLLNEVAEETKKGGKNAAQKLAKVFITYSHQSVAGLVHFPLSLENLPIFYIHHILSHLSIGDFQETSTRYVAEFDKTPLMDMSPFIGKDVSESDKKIILEGFTALSETAQLNFKTISDQVGSAHEKYIERETQLRQENKLPGLKVSKGGKDSRTLDIARASLPVGSRSNMFGYNSLRGWIETYKALKSIDDPISNMISEQLMTVLKITGYEEGQKFQGDTKDLVKHSEPTGTVEKNTNELEKYILSLPQFQEFINEDNPNEVIEGHLSKVELSQVLKPGEALAFQYISPLFIRADKKDLLETIIKLPNEIKSQIGRVIIQNHNHHDIMGVKGDVRGSHIIFMKTALAYIRDLIRHRAPGRLVEMQEIHTNDQVESIIKEGFNLNHQLTVTPELIPLAEGITDLFKDYYARLLEYYYNCKERLGEDADLRFVLHLLPLGHQSTLQLSGSITQILYMISQRWAPGGDIGYRALMVEVVKLLAEDDPFLSEAIEPFNQMTEAEIKEALNGFEAWASRK